MCVCVYCYILLLLPKLKRDDGETNTCVIISKVRLDCGGGCFEMKKARVNFLHLLFLLNLLLFAYHPLVPFSPTLSPTLSLTHSPYRRIHGIPARLIAVRVLVRVQWSVAILNKHSGQLHRVCAHFEKPRRNKEISFFQGELSISLSLALCCPGRSIIGHGEASEVNCNSG